MVCPPKLPLHQRGGAIRRRNRGYETLVDIARSYNVSPATLPPASPPLCHGERRIAGCPSAVGRAAGPVPAALGGRVALADIAALVDEARAVRDGLTAYAVLNAADPGTSSDNADAAAALADFPQLTLLDTPIRRRKAFANATGQGLSVDELTPLDPKASSELSALVNAVQSMVEPSQR
jgi:hypothetical protein